MYCEDLSLFVFPFNVIAGAILVLGTWVLHVYYARTTAVRFLLGMKGTLVVTGLLVAILLVEGVWALQLFRTWPFIILLILMLVVLQLIVLKHIRTFTVRNVLFALNHAGLWLALFAALFGSPDRVNCKMIAPLQKAEYNGLLPDRTLYPLPFTVTLEGFEVEHYISNDEKGAPKRFISTLLLDDQGKRERVTVEVNKPASCAGYSIYQDGYDEDRGNDSRYVILLIVRDPWIGLVYTGIFMLIAGAVGLVIYGPIRKKKCYDVE